MEIVLQKGLYVGLIRQEHSDEWLLGLWFVGDLLRTNYRTVLESHLLPRFSQYFEVLLRVAPKSLRFFRQEFPVALNRNAKIRVHDSLIAEGLKRVHGQQSILVAESLDHWIESKDRFPNLAGFTL